MLHEQIERQLQQQQQNPPQQLQQQPPQQHQPQQQEQENQPQQQEQENQQQQIIVQNRPNSFEEEKVDVNEGPVRISELPLVSIPRQTQLVPMYSNNVARELAITSR